MFQIAEDGKAAPAPSSTVRVFVSSTWLDLQPERAAIEVVLQRFCETKFVGMEYFGSASTGTEETSLAALERCHLCVLLVGSRYGSGITEAEYRRAQRIGVDCFIYAVAGAVASNGDEALARFYASLRQSHTVSEFHNADQLASVFAADLHNWLVDKWLPRSFFDTATRGIASLPADYGGRVQNFLTEYLGAPRAPVPFGGRAAEMASLDRWLRDEEKPYALMTAPAGRGKSALVARWASIVGSQPLIRVVFFPISVRFRTNMAAVVFMSLAAKLADIFGDDLRVNAETTVEMWRGLVSGYLRRRLPGGERLLIILDGLDEAGDWSAGADLFPADPVDSLRVLVTARYRAGDLDGRSWMETLGWSEHMTATIDLPRLTRDGVRDALARMGTPLDYVATKVDIVGELFRLSEGDPLLVRLYVRDLWARGAKVATLLPEDLRAIRPGLEGYFQRWWREQKLLWGDDAPLRRQSVQTILNVLSCALGPLTSDDIAAVVPNECQLNRWTLEEAIESLSRFIVGDGKEQGYVFSHPRLANHFYDSLSAMERRTWEGRFVAWGAKCVEALKSGALEPSSASPYLIRHYGAHLERAACPPADLLALVNNAWRMAWLHLGDGHRGYLNDVDRAWSALEAADRERINRALEPQWIAAGVRCALCFASVASLAGNIRPGLLRALVDHEVWTIGQAVAFVREIPIGQKRVASLEAIAEHLPASMIEEAVGLAGEPAPPSLIRRLAQCGYASRAIELLRERSWDTEWISESIKAAGTELGNCDPEGAMTAIVMLRGSDRLSALQSIAGSMDQASRERLLPAELADAIVSGYEDGIVQLAGLLPAESIHKVLNKTPLPKSTHDELAVSCCLLSYLSAERRAEVLGRLEAKLDLRINGQRSILPLESMLANAIPFANPALQAKIASALSRERISQRSAERIAPYLTSEDAARLVRAEPARFLPLLASKLVEDVIEDLVAIGDDDVAGLVACAPYLSKAKIDEHFAALTLGYDDALVHLIPWLDREQVNPPRFHYRRSAWAAERLVRRFCEWGEWAEALRVLDEFENRLEFDRLLIGVCRALGPQKAWLREALKRTRNAVDEAEVLAAIADVLPREMLLDALASAQRVGDGRARDAIRLSLANAFWRAGNVGSAIELTFRTSWRDQYSWFMNLAIEDRALAQRTMRETLDTAVQQMVGCLLLIVASVPRGVPSDSDERYARELVGRIRREDGSVQWDALDALLGLFANAETAHAILEAVSIEARAWALPAASRAFSKQPKLLRDLVWSLSGFTRTFTFSKILEVIEEVDWLIEDDLDQAFQITIGLNFHPRAVEKLAKLLQIAEDGFNRLSAQWQALSSQDKAKMVEALSQTDIQFPTPEIWAWASAIEDPVRRVRQLAIHLHRWSEPERSTRAREVLTEAIQLLKTDPEALEALKGVSGYLDEKGFQLAWKGLNAIKAGEARTLAELEILERAPVESLGRFHEEACRAARALNNWRRLLPIAARMPAPWDVAVWRTCRRILLREANRSADRWQIEEFLRSAPEWLGAEVTQKLAELRLPQWPPPKRRDIENATRFRTAEAEALPGDWERAMALKNIDWAEAPQDVAENALRTAASLQDKNARMLTLQSMTERYSRISERAAAAAGALIAESGIEGHRPLEVLELTRNRDYPWWPPAACKVLDLALARLEARGPEEIGEEWNPTGPPDTPAQIDFRLFANIGASLEPAVRLRYWRRTLRLLGRSKRSEMLERFVPMLGWVGAMCGNHEWGKIAEALEQTFEWWLP